MNPTRRIGLILTVIFLIPALFFSVYEISSLNKDEKMIEDIYQRQLETILFSVNQYSDDALNSWISKTQAYLEISDDSTRNAQFENLLLLNSPIQSIFVLDSAERLPNIQLYCLDSAEIIPTRSFLNKQLWDKQPDIQQLLKYKKSGFQKSIPIVPLYGDSTDRQIIIFISEYESSKYRVNGFVLKPEVFIENMVGPRLQSVAKDQFILSVHRKSTNALIYSSLVGDSIVSTSIAKDVWMFPDYALGIRTPGPSLQQLVRQRTLTNLYLLIGLDVVLIVALGLAFRSIKREVQLAQNKSDFVANVSHEIRTPLALISMFAETLELGRVKTEEKKQEYYTIINKEAHRLTGIVNKILNFSQTEAGKKQLQLAPLDISLQLDDVLKTYDFHLKNKGFTYTKEWFPGLRIVADKEAVTEIFINLLDNAIKYSVDHKEITIRTGQQDTLGWLSIQDHGVGISKGDQKHIFDKFYRVSSGDLAKSPGTGLGLSLVKQLVEKQNGKISVKSDQGEGTTFIIYFPLAN
jgi:two-component system, OmpR family, phosphate regulon sensor histidine kinase PhoR